MSIPVISIIIPHKGRERFLIQTLESISLQEFDLSTVEVILVTQNDDISEDILEFKPAINLSVFKRPVEESISALRNFGVEKSTGAYNAFLDADVYLSSNWVPCMLDKLNEIESRVITSAVQINSSDAPPLEKIRTALSNASTDTNVNFLPGRNLFLRRDTFRNIGGFPVHLITCEDYYFTGKANNLGDLYYTSEASYIHLGEDQDFAGMYKKEVWRGQSNLLSIKGRSIPLREIPSFVIPIALCLLFILALVALISSQFALAFTCFIAILIPVSVYISRLYLLTKNVVRLSDIVKFYLYYFPARALGTVGGVFKSFSSGH